MKPAETRDDQVKEEKPAPREWRYRSAHLTLCDVYRKCWFQRRSWLTRRSARFCCETISTSSSTERSASWSELFMRRTSSSITRAKPTTTTTSKTTHKPPHAALFKTTLYGMMTSCVFLSQSSCGRRTASSQSIVLRRTLDEASHRHLHGLVGPGALVRFPILHQKNSCHLLFTHLASWAVGGRLQQQRGLAARSGRRRSHLERQVQNEFARICFPLPSNSLLVFGGSHNYDIEYGKIKYLPFF